MTKVRVNSIYKFMPVWIDRFTNHYGDVKIGDLVRVVNIHGCPKANTMGHCYIQTVDTKEFIGLVCTSSLEKL